MFEKVALISLTVVMAGSLWKTNTNQAAPLAKASDNFARECRLVLKEAPTTWLERLKAARCGAWRDTRA